MKGKKRKLSLRHQIVCQLPYAVLHVLLHMGRLNHLGCFLDDVEEGLAGIVEIHKKREQTVYENSLSNILQIVDDVLDYSTFSWDEIIAGELYSKESEFNSMKIAELHVKRYLNHPIKIVIK